MDTENGEVESPQTEETLSDVSTNDLRTALENASEEESSQEMATEETPSDGLEFPPTEEEISGGEEISEEDRLAKRRIRPRNELDQQVIDLYRSDGFDGSFAEASNVIYGQIQQPQPPVQQAMEQAPRPDPLAGLNERADALKTEIVELDAKVQEAAENMETTEALNLQREVMRREMEIQNLENRRERYIERERERHFDAHRQKATASRDAALEFYPVLADKNSVQRKQFDHYVSQRQQDPDYAEVFKSPKWPELLANEFAISQVQDAPPAQQVPQAAPQQVPPQMGTQARVLTSGETAQPTNAPVSADTLINNMSNISNDDLYKLLGQPDGRRVLT